MTKENNLKRVAHALCKSNQPLQIDVYIIYTYIHLQNILYGHINIVTIFVKYKSN